MSFWRYSQRITPSKNVKVKRYADVSPTDVSPTNFVIFFDPAVYCPRKYFPRSTPQSRFEIRYDYIALYIN